jgi:sugar transferase EpsL
MAYAVKRLADVGVASLMLIVLAVPLAVIAAAIRLTMGRPMLFRQVRPGRGGRPFVLVKFRSMREAHDDEGQPLPDAERLTPLGLFLRRTSLDELPQFWNVLRGDISLVGPRPLLMEYLPLYTPEQARRHEVKPGITGWAQVNGRNGVDWEATFAHDVWYVDHWSLWLDVKIMAATFLKVLKGEGITGKGEEPTCRSPFLGIPRQINR